VLEEILRHKQSAAIGIFAFGAPVAPPARKPIPSPSSLRRARYYYLRNPLPSKPSPKPLIPPPWKLEIVASDISYASLRSAQEGIYNELQMEPVDYTTRLRYSKNPAINMP